MNKSTRDLHATTLRISVSACLAALIAKDWSQQYGFWPAVSVLIILWGLDYYAWRRSFDGVE